MVDIVLASNNKKKIAELQSLIDEKLQGKARILSLKDIGFTDDIDEYGKSFEANSLIKASAAAKLGYIGIADDSGLCVDALGGEPGIYSARYSADEGECDDRDAANRAKILRNLDGVPAEERSARFVCVASLVLPAGSPYKIPAKYIACPAYSMEAGVDIMSAATVRGECHGTILAEERGNGGFGYDSIFCSEETGCSFAEASPEAKNAVSHRGRAMEQFARLIEELIG
ncbi:MAG: non-canonical purine NTP pyrophosphatase [Clostridia bacterium]|nr:non-canonical purine NTP pyrophosphatase [Clostridia bacterium]